MDYGLDTKQFRLRIVRPVLQDIDLWSPAAENLVIGTGMHESHLTYLKQIVGPALGVFQMEPGAYRLHRKWLEKHPALTQKVDAFAIQYPDAEEMVGNLYFATAMCRVYYRAVEEPLPPSDRPDLLASYWKRYYNTVLGKGTVERALPHFELAVKEGAM